MSTALISLMTSIPVRRDIAMTGEITLTGRVLPVGGIREKSLAALTHGINTIILPLANQKDLADIPDEFKKKLSFLFVENLDEVLALTFDRKAQRQKVKDKSHKKPKAPAAAA